MKKKKIPIRKCIITNGMCLKKDTTRVVINRESEISADDTGKQQGRGAYVSKDVRSTEDARKNSVLKKHFSESPEKLGPIHREVVRLICREEIPK